MIFENCGRGVFTGGNFWQGASHGLMVAGLNHVAHSGLLGRGIAIGLRSGYIRHWWKPDANTATVGIGVEAGLAVSLETGEIEIHHGVNKGTHPYAELSIGAGIKAGASFTVSGEGLYYFGPRTSITVDKFYGARTNIISSAGLGGYYSAYATIGNKNGEGGRVAGWGIQVGIGVGGGAGINYGWSGSSLLHVRSIINE